MSEDCSSDEEWGLPFKKACATKCWECGKYFRHISDLMVHYISHSVKATCHVCKITFQRETSLSIHLDNVHSPPVCQKCLICFSNPEELNKHAETKCESNYFENSSQHHSGISNVVPLPTDLETQEEMETPGSFVEYLVGEDDQSETEVDDDDDDDDNDDDNYKDDSDEESCSENDLVNLQRNHKPRSINKTRVFIKKRNICKLCKKLFQSDQSHNEHLRAFYTCKLCYQVFFTKNLFGLHTCSNENNSFSMTIFCSNYMPKECSICKVFLANGKALQKHIRCVHKSVNKKGRVLSRKNSRINPQEANFVSNTDKKGIAVDLSINRNSIDRSVTTEQIEKSAPVTNTSTVCTASTKVKGSQGNVVFVQNTLPILPLPQGNQQLAVMMQNGTASQAPLLQNIVSFFQSSSAPSIRHFRPILKKPLAPLNTQMKESTSGPSHKSAPSTAVLPIMDFSIHDLRRLTPKPKETCTRPDTQGLADEQPQSEETAPSAAMSTVLAEFDNDSREKVLKSMNSKWGKVVISHRYLHRGHHSHLCQCGRAFKHRLHLLRHRVQHAEATGYICVGCGKTFIGLKPLAQHLKGKHHKTFYRRDNRVFTDHTYTKAEQNCAQPFICDCGHVFFKPSAFIWHQIKNKSK